MSDFWNDPQNRVARKEYRCIWCGQKIMPGETYLYQAGKFEGDFQSNHWHSECFDEAGKDLDLQDGFTPYDNDRPLQEKGNIMEAQS